MPEFLAHVMENVGDYLIVGSYQRSLVWAATQFRRGPAPDVVELRPGFVRWANGSQGLMAIVDRHGGLAPLRGMRVRGALVVYGDPAKRFPDELWSYLPVLASGPDFHRWGVAW